MDCTCACVQWIARAMNSTSSSTATKTKALDASASQHPEKNPEENARKGENNNDDMREGHDVAENMKKKAAAATESDPQKMRAPTADTEEALKAATAYTWTLHASCVWDLAEEVDISGDYLVNGENLVSLDQSGRTGTASIGWWYRVDVDEVHIRTLNDGLVTGHIFGVRGSFVIQLDCGFTLTQQQSEKCKDVVVEEVSVDDNSMIWLSIAKMEELGLSRGDYVLIKGEEHKDTVGIVLADKSLEDSKIRMNKVVRKNLRVGLGDLVSVHRLGDFVSVPKGKAIRVLPLDDTIEGFTGDLFDTYLQPYFIDCGRPVREGDLFLVGGGRRPVEFKVVFVDPGEFAIVAPETVVYCEGEPVQRCDEE